MSENDQNEIQTVDDDFSSENSGRKMSISVLDSIERLPINVRSEINDTNSGCENAGNNGLLPNRMEFDQIKKDHDTNSSQIKQQGKNAVLKFLKEFRCYELIKNSGKVVVLDVKIPVNLAFFALVEHDVKSAPLWNGDEGQFVGMITATDFVNILRYYYIRGSPMSELAEHSIQSWRAVPASMSLNHALPGMISISPEESLYSACMMLRQHRLHRLPVLDSFQNSVFTIVSYSGILEYLVATFREQRRLFDHDIYSLGIGTYEEDHSGSKIITLPGSTPLIRVLHTLIEKKISAIPLIDDKNGSVICVYSVSDVTELAKDRSLAQLDLPVIEILRIQFGETFIGKGVHFCSKHDTLHMLFEKFAAARVHRLICVDELNRCVGIVSLSDLFNYFLD